VDRLIVKVIPDNEVRLLALRKGDIHFAYGIDYQHFDSIKNSKDLKLHTTTTLGISFLALNCEEKPFDNLKVRQAMNHAINRERIFKNVFYGYGAKADQPIPPHWWGHNPKVPPYEYNPEKAKKLLAEAGYPNGFKTDLLTWNNPRPYCPSPRDFVSLVKSDAKRVGVEMDIKMMNWNAFLEARGKGGYGTVLSGWVSGTLDPDGIIYPLFDSKYIRKIDAINWARWRNPQADKSMAEARMTYDQNKRNELYQKVAMEIHKDSPAVFVAHPVVALAYRNNVKNIFIHDSHWVPLNQVYLE
jgi:peptide/nickel transport system substrate-binding protein